MRLATHDWYDSSEAETPAIAWEECTCLLCGSAGWMPFIEAAQHVHSGLRFQIVKCHRCGLCFTNPRPDRDSMQQFYPADYLPHHRQSLAQKKHFWTSDPLPKLLPLSGNGRLLDF